MTSFRFVVTFLLTNFLTSSCTRPDPLSTQESRPPSNERSFELADIRQACTPSTSPVSYCAQKLLPLCSDGVNVGTIEVSRGSDHKVYISYKTAAGYYLAIAKVFVASSSQGIYTSTAFNTIKNFSYPFTLQRYSVSFTALPDSVNIVAYAMVAKKSTGGTINGFKTAWGDGCSGRTIVSPPRTLQSSLGTAQFPRSCTREDMAGGYYFGYRSIECGGTPTPGGEPGGREPEICAVEKNNFFGIHPDYGIELPWTQPGVVIGPDTYTEAEARLIDNTANAANIPPDSKYAFEQAVVLLLSHTDYHASPTVGPAMEVIIDWLGRLGKLSPSHLPTGNAVVKAQATFLETWINTHICTGR